MPLKVGMAVRGSADEGNMDRGEKSKLRHNANAMQKDRSPMVSHADHLGKEINETGC